ncbi:MAG: hypothetical protein WCA07_17610 [Gloeobacterales cyanobacterium]
MFFNLKSTNLAIKSIFLAGTLSISCIYIPVQAETAGVLYAKAPKKKAAKKVTLSINRITISSPDSLKAGDELTLQVLATPSATATFGVEGGPQEIPFKEIQPGVYEANYTVRTIDKGTKAKLLVTLKAPNATAVTKAADTTISLNAPATAAPVPAVPTANPLRIEKITTRTPGPLLAGDELLVKATGTPKATATFAIEGFAQNLPLKETQEGVYEGTYVVRRNDSKANAKLLVTLSRQGSDPVTQAADTPISIDALAPLLQNAQPENGSSVASRTPDISISFSDGEGTGVDPQTIRLLVNGRDVTRGATIGRDFVAYRPSQALPDSVTRVEVQMADRAGNKANLNWSFGFGTPGNTTTPTPSGQFNLLPTLTNYKSGDSITIPANIEGKTAPFASVQIQASAASTVLGPIGLSQQILDTTIKADGAGLFTFTLQPAFNLPSGTRYRVNLTATDPQGTQSQKTEVLFVQK